MYCPLFNHRRGREVSVTEIPSLDRDAPGQRPLRTETHLDRPLLTENPLLDRDPSPDRDPPLNRDPTEQRPPWTETSAGTETPPRTEDPSCEQKLGLRAVNICTLVRGWGLLRFFTLIIFDKKLVTTWLATSHKNPLAQTIA